MTDDVRLVRARVLMGIDAEGSLALLDASANIHKLDGSSADLARAVLSFCAVTARSWAEILAHVEELIGQPISDPSVVEQLIELLRSVGALRIASAIPMAPVERRTSARVLLGVGGAVAAAHSPRLVQSLQARGFDVRVIATESALRFVGKEALEALTHRAVFSSLWQRDEGARAPHIELAEWPDAIVICPATASTLSRIATGDCSELLSAVAVVARVPILVAPSMNVAMYESPMVQGNIETLKRAGFHFVLPTFAVEVAHAPQHRAPMLGGAPGAEAVASLVQAMLRMHEIGARLPSDAAAWEPYHRRVPEASQAWFTAEVDPQIAGAIAAHCRAPSFLWDVGTGHGACAIWAAEHGFSVVATDVSRTALARARERAGPRPIVFVEDDVARSALASLLDVVVDRGTLCSLAPAERSAYARQILESTRPGAIVIVKVHAPPADPRVLSHPMAAAEIAALFGAGMTLLAEEPGTFAGTLDPAPASVMCVFRREPQ